MRDEFDQLLACYTIIQCTLHVAWQFVGTIKRDKARDRDQTAVALGKTMLLPHIAEQDLVGIC